MLWAEFWRLAVIHIAVNVTQLVRLSACQSLSQSVCLSVCLPVFVSVCLPLSNDAALGWALWDCTQPDIQLWRYCTWRTLPVALSYTSGWPSDHAASESGSQIHQSSGCRLLKFSRKVASSWGYFSTIWEAGEVPQDALIVHIYKWKGGNHWVFHFCLHFSILGRIIISRLLTQSLNGTSYLRASVDFALVKALLMWSLLQGRSSPPIDSIWAMMFVWR